MQNIRDFADAHGITVGELFGIAWAATHYNNRCTSGQVVKDYDRWTKSKGKIVPYYVARYLQMRSEPPTMPKGVK